MIQTRHTPGCLGSERVRLETSDVNRKISCDVFSYVECDTCGLLRLTNVPVDLHRFYPDEYYAVPTLEALRAIAESDTFKINLTQQYMEGGRLLDIGPAYGTFALQAKLAGFHVDAIEMDARCCEFLSQVVGVRAVCSAASADAIESLGPHEVITLWHAIEHLPDPWSVLAAAADNLTAGGILIVAAPNPEAWQFGLMGAEWPHIDAPRHLYLLPQRVLRAAAESLGLECLMVSTTDHDARGWNRFGWQRLIMNRLPGKWLKRAGFVGGWLLSFAMAPIEATEPRGAAYTIVFRKIVT